MEASNGPIVTVIQAAGLSGSVRSALHCLFDETYSQADHGYLDKSLELLRFVAIAAAGDASCDAVAGASGRPHIIGFALGETRTLDLPGLPAQRVGLAGLCCVHAAYRRQGLFRMLETSVIAEGTDRHGGERLLLAGRMAHPASLRITSANPGALPRPGVVASPFQREVARAIASCYAVEDFDPHTFVCSGPGRPIGYPRMDIDADAAEWELFANVDRDRGQSLLALSWIPDAPPGW